MQACKSNSQPKVATAVECTSAAASQVTSLYIYILYLRMETMRTFVHHCVLSRVKLNPLDLKTIKYGKTYSKIKEKRSARTSAQCALTTLQTSTMSQPGALGIGNRSFSTIQHPQQRISSRENPRGLDFCKVFDAVASQTVTYTTWSTNYWSTLPAWSGSVCKGQDVDLNEGSAHTVTSLQIRRVPFLQSRMESASSQWL